MENFSALLFILNSLEKLKNLQVFLAAVTYYII